MGQPIMLPVEANSQANAKDEFDGSVKRNLLSTLRVSESGSVKIQQRPASSDSHGQDQKMYKPYPVNKNTSSK